MVTRRSSSTSTREVSAPSDPLTAFSAAVRLLGETAEKARKHGFRLLTHNYYGPRARDQFTTIWRSFLVLRNTFPSETHPSVAAQLNQVEPLIGKVRVSLNDAPRDLQAVLRDIAQRAESDVAAAVQSNESVERSAVAPFLPPEIVPDGAYRRIVEEVNKCHRNECYNACAAMLRRLIENLIIEVFERKGIEDKIKVGDDYQELKALIGKAIGEQQLRLGRNTREALPKLKFFGDLSVHGRKNLVREPDLERLHGPSRAAVEELASHMQ